MASNRFTPKEDAFIIGNLEKMTNTEIAHALGRPLRHSVQKRAKILGLKRAGIVIGGVFHPYYSKEEDEIITKFYSSLGPVILAQQINRSKSAIQYHALKLNLKKNAPEHLNPTRVAKLLGVCRRTALKWIHLGVLKANKFGRKVGRFQEWKIETPDLHAFIREHYELFDPDRVKDEFLLSIIEATPAGKAISSNQAQNVLRISKSAINQRAQKGKFTVAYKGFGPDGHIRWYVQLPESVFEWFRDLVDDNDDNNKEAAKWFMRAIETRDPVLNILISYEPERMRQIRNRIRQRPAADRIVKEYEENTPEGRRLKALTSR